MTHFWTFVLLVAAVGLAPDSSQADDRPGEVIRVADVVGGHVHPSLTRARSGDLLAVYNREGGGGKELLLCRSRDGGRQWSPPRAVPTIRDCSIYPGSLTTLRDGRIALHWSCYRGEGERLWRVPQFALSDDDGETWSPPCDVPLENLTNYSCLRHPVVELGDGRWVCPFYDRTVVFDPKSRSVTPFGDRRNHGMVPIVQTRAGTLISGAPEADSGVPLGGPRDPVHGLRSTDGGQSWQALHAFPHFGVAGYDLCLLANGWIVLTAIEYGVGEDGEWAYSLIVSRDDGVSWDTRRAARIYSPGRRILGRGWPRTVQIDDQTLGTLFYDLDPRQVGGPGLFFVRTSLARLREQE